MGEIEFPKHKTFNNLLDKEFTRLTVIRYHGLVNNSHSWVCNCSCDKDKDIRKEIIVQTRYLITHHKKSCGCLLKERGVDRFTTHGLSKTEEYKTWRAIKARCYDETHINYHLYGGRGIKMCDRWLESVKDFISDIGQKPGKNYSIDRIDVNGDYSPSNCRWATSKEQSNNTRKSVFLEFENERLTVPQWSERLNLSEDTIHSRLRLGWPVKDVLTKPVRRKERWKKNEQIAIQNGEQTTKKD